MRLVTFLKAIYVAGTLPRANLRHEGSRHADKEIIRLAAIFFLLIPTTIIRYTVWRAAARFCSLMDSRSTRTPVPGRPAVQPTSNG